MDTNGFIEVTLWKKTYRVQVFPTFRADFHISLENDERRLFGHIFRPGPKSKVQFVFTDSKKVRANKWKKQSEVLRIGTNQTDAYDKLDEWLSGRGLQHCADLIEEALQAFKAVVKNK